MGSSTAATLARMDLLTDELISDFEQASAEFDERFECKEAFTGPSTYFHQRALARRRELGSAQLACRDSYFQELVYATLASWGMHRMGKGGSKLTEFPEFRDGLESIADLVATYADRTIDSLADEEIRPVGCWIWDLLWRAHPSATSTQIVAGSKAIHHILPDLVPPIDNEYTLQFFYARKGMTLPQKDIFLEVFPRFVRIARAKADFIGERLGARMNTSRTKVVDNAIIGWMKRGQAIASGR